MLDIYGYRPFPFRICISGGSSAVAVAVLIIATLYGPSRGMIGMISTKHDSRVTETVAVGEGEGAGGGANVRAVGAPFPQLIPNLTKVQCTYSAT